MQLNVQHFQKFTREIPEAASAFEAGRLQIELLVSSSTLT